MDELVKEGVLLNEKSKQVGLAPILQYEYLVKAFRLFNEALQKADNLNQRVSLAKNCATTSMKAAKLKTERKKKMFGHHISHSVLYFSYALFHGTHRPEEWRNDVMAQVLDIFELIHHSPYPFDARISFFLQLIPLLSPSLLLSQLNLHLATLYFNQAITQQENKQWTTSKSTLENATRYINDGLRFCQDDFYLRAQLEDLEERKRIHFSIAEAIVVLDVADSLYSNSISNDEFLNLDQMWIVADFYKLSADLSHENNLEGEAIAFSRLGRVFNKIFKTKEKAHHYYRFALQIALTLVPRDFSQSDWYTETQTFLQEYQAEKIAEEEEKKSKSKEVYLNLLSETLELIRKESNCGATSLLQYLYKTHPPKNPTQTIPTETELKKQLIRCISHYHPDKQTLNEADPESMKWYVLCEEITKILNYHYQILK